MLRCQDCQCKSVELSKICRLTDALCRADLTGNINLAQHGTHLAEARTGTFDVLALDQYAAARVSLLFNSEGFKAECIKLPHG